MIRIEYITNQNVAVDFTAWTSVTSNFTLNNFGLVRERDLTDLLVVRDATSGDISFYCEHYEFLKTFALTRTPYKCKIYEDVCGIEVMYLGWLIFSPELDFYNKKLTASVKLHDNYSELIDGIAWYLSNKYVECKVLGFDFNFRANQFQGFTFEWNNQFKIFTNESPKALNYFIINFLELFKSQVNRILQQSVFFGRPNITTLGYYPDTDILNNLYLSVKKHYFESYTYESIEKINVPDTSISDILTILRENYFIYWYIDTNNVLQFKRLKNFFANGDDYSNEILNPDKKIQLKQPNFNTIEYKQFDWVNYNGLYNDKLFYFSDLKYNFGVNSTANKTVNNNYDCNPYIFDTDDDKIMLLLASYYSQNVDYSLFTKQFDFRPVPQDEKSGMFASGDFSSLQMYNNNTSYDMFLTSKTLHAKVNEKFRFQFTMLSSDTYTGIKFLIGNSEYTIVAGLNTVNITFLTEQDFTIGFKLTKKTDIILPTIAYLMTNLTANSLHGNHLIMQTINNVINKKLSNVYNIVEQKLGVEAPAQTTLFDIENIYEQTINIDYSENISNLDFNKKIKTNVNYLRIDKIERTYKLNNFSLLNLTLTGK